MASSGHGVLRSITSLFGMVDQHGGPTLHSSKPLRDVVKLGDLEMTWTIARPEKDGGVRLVKFLGTRREIAHTSYNVVFVFQCCNVLYFEFVFQCCNVLCISML